MVYVSCFDITQIQNSDYEMLYDRALPERKARADRYLHREDKVRCIAADALLRRAVWDLLSVRDFEVVQDAFGKPHLKNAENFHYNISHSGRWVVIAYADAPVGIDIQEMRMNAGKEDIVRRHFTDDEREYVFRTEGSRRAERFYQIWTAKESYLKYLGIGLRRALNSFSVLHDGMELGVRMRSLCLGEYCMTLCSLKQSHTMQMLTLEQLLINGK